MNNRQRRLPSWLVKKYGPSEQIHEVKVLLRKAGLHTVCESARCPNLGECFSKSTATFMIMGDVCTRECKFCAVGKGSPSPLDLDEPRRVARASRKLALKHVVITSVTRDDLEDGGAAHFAATIGAVRELTPESMIEVLTPDFAGSQDAIAAVAGAEPDIFNHNIETVPLLYSRVRPQAEYRRSLDLLAKVKQLNPKIKTKSGLMLGLGETKEQVLQVMRDLRRTNCDFITIGQYLRPGKDNLAVERFVLPREFEDYRDIGRKMGFAQVQSQPFARSSYQADKTSSGEGLVCGD